MEIEDNLLQISRVADNISAVLIRYNKPKISGISLNKLLVEAGFLEITDGVKLPTNSGKEIGISTIKRSSSHGNYTQCLFGAAAQHMCLELVLNAQEE